jgi:hypothetical protein
MPRCKTCYENCRSKESLIFHQRKVHQPSVDLTCPITGQVTTVQRTGKHFKCILCPFKTDLPEEMQEHAECYLGAIAPDIKDFHHAFQNETESEDPVLLPQEIVSFLYSRYLFFDTERRLLYCTKCGLVIDGNVHRHVKKHFKTRVRFTPKEIGIFHYIRSQAKPFTPKFDEIEMEHPHLKITHGFRCLTCNKVAKKYGHLSCHNNYVRQPLQRNGVGRIYFPIYMKSSETSVEDVTQTLDPDTLCKSMMGPEPEGQLPKISMLFINSTGFFLDPGERVEAKREKFLSYFDPPDFLQQGDILSKLFAKMFDLVRNLKIPQEMYLYIVEYLRIGETSEKKYTETFIKIINFSIKFTEKPFNSEFYTVNSNVSVAVRNFRSEPSIENLSLLVEALFQESTVNTNMTTMLLATRLLCLDKDYSLKLADAIQKVFSQCKKLVRLGMVIRAMFGQPEEAFEYLNLMKTRYLHCQEPYVMSSLYLYKSLAQRSVHKSIVRFAPTKDPNFVQLDGVPVDMRFFEIVPRKLRDAAQKLVSQLSFDLEIDLDSLTDDIRKDSSICKGKSADLGLRNLLLLHVVKTPALREKFFDKISDDMSDATFNLDTVQSYTELLNELQLIFVALFHMGYGMPARATEICDLLIESDEYNQRNFFLIDEMIILEFLRNKNANFPAIIRALEKVSSRIVLIYILVIVPFADLMLKKTSPGYRGDLLKYMFNYRGKRCSDRNITTMFAQGMERYGGCATGFNDYRQLVELRIREKGMKDFEAAVSRIIKITEEHTTIADLQMGHSGGTALKNYASTTMDLFGNCYFLVQEYIKMCVSWHISVCLTEGPVTKKCECTSLQQSGGVTEITLSRESRKELVNEFSDVAIPKFINSQKIIHPNCFNEIVSFEDISRKCFDRGSYDSIDLLRKLLRG